MRVKMPVTKIKLADSTTKGFLNAAFVCTVIGCTGWAKFTGKVQLPVLAVIFQ
jgi:hydrogenase maturation factor